MNNPEADHEAVSRDSLPSLVSTRLTSSSFLPFQIIQERFVKDSQFIKIMTAEIVRP